MEMLQLTGVCDLAPVICQKVSAKHSAATNTNMSRFTECITELLKDDLRFMGMQSIHPVSFSHTQMSLIEFLTANDRKSYYVLLYCPSACHCNLSVVLRFSSFYCCDAYT